METVGVEKASQNFGLCTLNHSMETPANPNCALSIFQKYSLFLMSWRRSCGHFTLATGHAAVAGSVEPAPQLQTLCLPVLRSPGGEAFFIITCLNWCVNFYGMSTPRWVSRNCRVSEEPQPSGRLSARADVRKNVLAVFKSVILVM